MRWENSMTDQVIKMKLSGMDLLLIIDLMESKINNKKTSPIQLFPGMPNHLHHPIMKKITYQVVIQDPEDLVTVDISIVMEKNMMIMILKANMITKESTEEKATITEEKTSSNMKVEITGAIMEKMISIELSIISSTFYTQSNSLT